MNIQIDETYEINDRSTIIKNLWDHNKAWATVDIHPLQLTIRDEFNEIIAGLVAQTWWNALEVQYLWVKDIERDKGYGKMLMVEAEKVALERGCHISYVDTFDFQASDFYKKLGYSIYGELDGYAHKFTRYYMAKKI